MDPVFGQIITGAAVLVLAFFCGRSTLRGIKAELRGEGTCFGCSGCHSKAGASGCAVSGGSGCGKSGEACLACMKRMEEMKRLAENRQSSPAGRKDGR